MTGRERTSELALFSETALPFPLSDRVSRHAETPIDIDALQQAVEQRLRVLSPDGRPLPQSIGGVVRYSLLAPGKRLRPLLAILTAIQCGAGAHTPMDFACAAEMVHVASLILDDLPCMDDAALRRGQPTSHRAFGEDAAILSAISLLALAFRTIGEDQTLPHDTRVALVSSLSETIGPGGLVAGQMSDLRCREPDASLSRLRGLNARKTAALFCACSEAGVVIAGGAQQDRDRARSFAENIGMAFQIFDDLKDVALSSFQAGKDVRKDKVKPTVVSRLGRGMARSELRAHLDRAREDAVRIGARHDPLLAFVDRCFPDRLLDEVSSGAA